MVLLHLSQLSPQVWQRPYPKQTHTYHMGSAVPLDVVVFILLINSGKAPGSEAELEIFSHCKASHHGHGCGWLSGWEQQSHPSRSGQRVVLSSSPPAAPRYPSRSCLGRYWASRGFSCRTFVWKADQAQATLGGSVMGYQQRGFLGEFFAVLTQSSRLAGPSSLPVPVVSYFFLITKSQFNTKPAQFPCTV